jgi:nitrite reductase/ring-hydroxylating ferredoxin subunit
MSMVPSESPTSIPICESSALIDKGDGVRFPARMREGPINGFVVRYEGKAYGFLNRCAHAGIELDWQRGKFFERGGLYLMCATHGAIYAPDSGRCAGGPCRGQGLRAIVIEERDGTVFWCPDQSVFAVDATASST